MYYPARIFWPPTHPSRRICITRVGDIGFGVVFLLIGILLESILVLAGSRRGFGSHSLGKSMIPVVVIFSNWSIAALRCAVRCSRTEEGFLHR